MLCGQIIRWLIYITIFGCSSAVSTTMHAGASLRDLFSATSRRIERLFPRRRLHPGLGQRATRPGSFAIVAFIKIHAI